MAKWLALFTLVPLAETFLLYVIGQQLGFWPTVAIILVTGVVGAGLAKREGLRVLEEWKRSLAKGQMPEEGIVGGLLVLVGGVLLLTPGVLTDVVGVTLLIPPSRRFIAKHVRKYVEKRFAEGATRVQYRVDLGGGGFRETYSTSSSRVRGSGRDAVIDTVGEVIEERRASDARGELES
ncbi:MAG: FxsA family protein [Sandaracinaceae bacterium]